MIAAIVTQAGARIVCLFSGHKRGKRSDPMTVNCPRCGRPKKLAQKAKA